MSSASLTTSSSAQSQDSLMPIQILGINDFHGNINTSGTANLQDSAGSTVTVKSAGTAALLAGYLDSAQSSFVAANPNGATIRVEAGDMISASPAASALLDDQPTIAALQQMGIQVGTLGNHEFDKGLDQLVQVMNGQEPTAGRTPAIDAYYAAHTADELAGKYQIVISNVVDTATGKIPEGFKPYTIETVKDGNQTAKIGFIGVITQETPILVVAKNVAAYTFTDPAEAIAKYSDELRAQGVNAIVVLGHTGSVQTGSKIDGETTDIIKKLDQIDPANSVDLYVAGHSHTFTNGLVDGKRVVQATSFGKAYDDVVGNYDFATNDFESTPTAQIVAVDPKNTQVKPDMAVQKIVDEAVSITGGIINSPIGQTAPNGTILSTRNTNANATYGESPLGDLVTQAQLYEANQVAQADIAFTNNGGIRADITATPDGTITWGAAQAAQPFGNALYIVEMTGKQIAAVLNEQTFGTKVVGGSDYWLQSSGLTYTVTDNPDKTDLEHPYVVSSMTLDNGTKIDPTDTTKKYHVAINEFLKGGGDGFSGFKETKIVGALDSDTYALINYIKALTAKGEKVPLTYSVRKTYVSSQNKTIGQQVKNSPTSLAPIAQSMVASIGTSSASSPAKSDKTKLPNTADKEDSETYLVGGVLIVAALTMATFLRRKKEIYF
jgi:5'-nucleotidase